MKLPSWMNQSGTRDQSNYEQRAQRGSSNPGSSTTDPGTSTGNPGSGESSELMYGIDEVPPWYMCILLGMQHYLTMLGAVVGVPFVLSPFLCIASNYHVLGKLISTIFFTSGIVTLIQSSVGVRLPVIQGGTYTFITPAISILALHGDCTNETDWKERIVEVQGAIIVSSVLQVLVGLTGCIGFIIRFIGPLTVVPSVTLVGLSLFGAASFYGSAHWGVCFFHIVLITVFSQVLSRIEIRFFPLFKLFPVLFAIAISWILSIILTEAGAFSDNPSEDSYRARTDAMRDVLRDAPWFYMPYPFQWGWPAVTVAGVFGMMAGVIAGMVESVADYFACANLAGAPPPAAHAINRGMLVEGLGCMLAGVMGTGNGTTTYSENIGTIGITKVGSRRVIQFGSVIMLFFACFAKFGALFATLPDPIIGANFFCMFGVITAVGLSPLQFVNLNSSRNLYILGFSLFSGISVPQWMAANPGYVDTGVDEIDQIITVLLSTGMFVGGLLGCLLDNLIPGSAEDRGIDKWRRIRTDPGAYRTDLTTYDLPLVTKFIQQLPWTRFVPVSPTFMREGAGQSQPAEDKDQSQPGEDMDQSPPPQPPPAGAENGGFRHEEGLGEEPPKYTGTFKQTVL